MKAETWNQVKAVSDKICGLPSEVWPTALDESCRKNTKLRRHVEAMLKEWAEERESAPSDPLLGRRIWSYRILREIGRGGMGIVYLAQQEEPIQRLVALKAVRLGMNSEEIVSRFQRERQALALMNHPCIAKVFDAGMTEEGRSYFVMEYVKGKAISEYCDLERMPIRDRLELFIQLCTAINHAHQKGIIHRDIKPTNVLVEKTGDRPLLKVIDFGVSKAIETARVGQTLLTRQGMHLGTPAYMSPEQVDMLADIDTLTDVYSLGVVFYELLIGALPFDLERFSSVGFDEMRRIVREEDPPAPSVRLSDLGPTALDLAGKRSTDPKTLRNQLRPDLDAISKRALAKSRSDRYQAASEFAADVRRYLTNQPVLASSPSASYRLNKFIKRHKVQAVTIGAVVLTVMIGAIVSTVFYGIFESRRREVRQLLSESYWSRGQREVEAARITSASHFLARSAVQFLSPSDELSARTRLSNLGQVALLKRFEFGERVLGSTPNHDGDQILIWTRDGSLQLWSAVDGSKVPLAMSPKESILGATFSSDDLQVLAWGRGGSLVSWQTADGSRSALFQGHERPVRGATFSRDKTTVLSWGFDGTLRLWNAKDGSLVVPIMKQEGPVSSASFSRDEDLILSTGGAANTGSVYLWNANTGSLAVSPMRYKGSTRGAVFNHDETLVLAWGDETDKDAGGQSTGSAVRLWKVDGTKPPIVMIHGGSSLLGATFSPNERQIASWSFDGTIRLWNVVDGSESTPMILHSSRGFRGVHFAQDGTRLLSWGNDPLNHQGSVALWSTKNGSAVFQPVNQQFSIRGAQFNLDDEVILSWGEDGAVRVWRTSDGSLAAPLMWHREEVLGAIYNRNLQSLMSWDRGGDLCLWSIAPSLQVASHQKQGGFVTGAALNRAGSLVLSWSGNMLRLSKATDGSLVVPPMKHDQVVKGAAFSRDERLLLSWSGDSTKEGGRVQFWDALKGSPTCPPMVHDRVLVPCNI